MPQDRRIVPGLSVRDNLGRIVSVFPVLGERLEQDGTRLSGGAQRMLAIARAIVSGPRMIREADGQARPRAGWTVIDSEFPTEIRNGAW